MALTTSANPMILPPASARTFARMCGSRKHFTKRSRSCMSRIRRLLYIEYTIGGRGVTPRSPVIKSDANDFRILLGNRGSHRIATSRDPTRVLETTERATLLSEFGPGNGRRRGQRKIRELEGYPHICADWI